MDFAPKTSVGRRKNPCRSSLRLVWLALLVPVTAVFIWRGPLRGLRDGYDFAMLYAASGAWCRGENPYRYEPVIQGLRASGGDRKHRLTRESLISVYPPTLFPLLAPLSYTSWSVARTLWLVINLGATVTVGLSLIRLVDAARSPPTTLVLIVILLAWAPLHTAIAVGQTSVTVMAVVLSALVTSRNRPMLVGGLLGAATALKPQLGGIFLLYLVLRRRWRALCWSALFLATILLIGLTQLNRSESAQGWYEDWMNNMQTFAHGEGDSSPRNPNAFQTINLHYLLHTYTANRTVVRVCVYAIGAVLGALAIGLGLTSRNPEDDPALLSLLGVLSLLMVYHRFYDAVLLLLPAAWVVSRVMGGRVRAWDGASIVMLAFFLAPGAAILGKRARDGLVSADISATWWWRCLVMPHQVWALCGLCVCLLGWMVLRHREADGVRQ